MSNKYHIAVSGKEAGKYVRCDALKACRNGGTHITQAEYDKANALAAATSPEDVFRLVDSGALPTITEPQWSLNEAYITEVIDGNLPEGFIAKRMGSSDSTVSDVAIYDKTGKLVTFVEAKSEKSQCGQFVLTEDANGVLTATSGLENPHTIPLTNILNAYRKTNPSDKKIDPNKLSDTDRKEVYDWIRDHYRGMGASFIAVTDNDNSYVRLVPLEELEGSVNVTLNYPRIKQSGSADLPKTQREAFEQKWFSNGLSNREHKMFTEGSKTLVEINGAALSTSEQYVDEEKFFLSKIRETSTGNVYAVKKRSTTKNINEVLGFEYIGEKTSGGFNLLGSKLRK